MLTIFACHRVSVEVIESKLITIDNNISIDSCFDSFIQPYRATSQIVAQLPIAQLSTSYPPESKELALFYAELIADYLQDSLSFDIAVFNAGSLRTGLNEGIVTYSDLIAFSPFNNKFVILALSGKEVKELILFLAQEKNNHAFADLNRCILIDTNNQWNTSFVGIDEANTYKVLTTNYLSEGKDNFHFFNPSQVIEESSIFSDKILFDIFPKKYPLKQ